MSYQYGNSQYGYPPQDYSNSYAQPPPQSYQQTPPQIRNPFAPPPQAQNAYGTQYGGADHEQEAQMLQWQQNYAPPEAATGKKDARGKLDNPNTTQLGQRNPALPAAAESKPAEGGKQMTVVRKGGGQTWEDKSLLEWDPTQFRIMVGNLAGEVTDDSLAKAFAQYGVAKARVVRDKRTTKSKGFGFVAFTDGEQGFKAAREMLGKYIGSHPVTIQRARTDVKPVVQKDRYHKGKNNQKDKNREKKEKKQDEADPLRANTGAHIEKKPVKNAAAYKVIG